MPGITFEGRTYPREQSESVLDALLRNGVQAPHSCKAGSCGSCLMRAEQGVVPARAQAGLKDSWRSQGYFLACVCHPDGDLAISKVGSDAELGATLADLRLIGAGVMRVRLHCDAALSFRPGQYVTLVREGGLARSYSIASLPEESAIELHVRRVEGGQMSTWLHETASVGDRVSVIGPSGECFYVPGKEDQPLLLVGTGTGLAPLYGILRDALRHGHRGPIHLFHGALHRGGLYLTEELRRIADRYSHVEYTPAVLNGTAEDDLAVGAIDDVVLRRFPKLAGWRGYVCGDPALVKLLRKKLFLSGMGSREIYADAFVPAAQTS
ncbi:MAG: FAD-binding oxidoreductase [Bryobacteraceae bacterium]|nr:FAD-binding oxidoreductase [Bryobacteraceae bacterium]